MTYFSSIRSNIKITQSRLGGLLNFLEKEYINTPKKVNAKVIREYSNEIFDKMEDIVYLENRLDNLAEGITHVEEYELGIFNVNQIKFTDKIIRKMTEVFVNTEVNNNLLKFAVNIVKKIKIGFEENIENNSVIDLSIEEIQQLKLSALVRYIVKKLAFENKFSKIDIDNMQDINWCKNVLKLNNPLIKCFGDADELEERKINNVVKYYKDIFLIDSDQYFLCNDVSERSRKIFIEWYNVKTNELFNADSGSLLSYDKDEIEFHDNKVGEGSNINIEVDSCEMKDEYLTDPFKILAWLDQNPNKKLKI